MRNKDVVVVVDDDDVVVLDERCHGKISYLIDIIHSSG